MQLLSQPPPPLMRLTSEHEEGDREWADAVRAHFEQNRPAPSSLPAVSLQVLNAITQPDLSLSELTRLVAQDPAMAAGILKVANSAAYQSVQEIQTLRDAVTRLGLTEVGRVAGALATRSLFTPNAQPGSPKEPPSVAPRWGELFADSVASARASAWQAMRVRGARSDHAFVAGMLHDLGRPLALRSLVAVSNTANLGHVLDEARIDRVLEAVHVEVGKAVHAEWALPTFPSLVAARHHDLQLPADAEHRDLHVVRLVSAMVQYRRQSWRVAVIRSEVNESCAALGLDAFALRSLDTQIREELVHVEQAFGGKAKRRAG